jgi:hypothetical protein
MYQAIDLRVMWRDTSKTTSSLLPKTLARWRSPVRASQSVACVTRSLRFTSALLLERQDGQAWPPWVDTIASTASRLNEAGFWRGGNLAKFSICAATVACMR